MAIRGIQKTDKAADDLSNGSELLELDDICRLTKQSKTTIYRQGKAGEFPKPKKLPSGAIRWTAASYRRWVERLPDAEWAEIEEQPAAAGPTQEAA